MNDPVLLSHVRELIAQKRKAAPPPTDEERVTALFDLARRGNHDLLEEFSMTSPAWREVIAGIKAEVVTARRVEFEQRQAIKQRATLALAKPTAEDLVFDESEPRDAREAARRAEKRGHRWWEPVRTMVMGGGELSEEAQAEEDRKNDKEAEKLRAKRNRQADFYAQEVRERIQREEVIKNGATWFGWLRG